MDLTAYISKSIVNIAKIKKGEEYLKILSNFACLIRQKKIPNKIIGKREVI